ncbi:hypothetical protein NGM10_13055 [Halorussus salilacus]|uniref:hypothetical protein n=1 Tax=Halorussus salilacus TaxID=2953750 RepID=UPI00209F1779|nr:hypothetical protein [Halorussus salilacus]USZ67652.1 hypothetical protein NGM10_13055 [Halorussus salilacus]
MGGNDDSHDDFLAACDELADLIEEQLNEKTGIEWEVTKIQKTEGGTSLYAKPDINMDNKLGRTVDIQSPGVEVLISH